MKKFVFIFIVTLALSSCLTMQQKAQQQWPTNNSYVNYFLVPHAYKTSDDAISVIKLSQPNFCEMNGEEVVNLQVDQYGLLLKTRWKSTYTEYRVRTVNTYSWGTGYNTTNVGGYETTTDSGHNSYSMMFKKIGSVSLIHQKYLDRQNKWQIIFWCDDSDNSVLMILRAKDKGTAIDVINAVFTLGLKAGAKIDMPTVGIYYSLLTINQAMTLGNPDMKGVVINTVQVDSPAQKSGILVNDIVTNVNGYQVTTVEDLTNEITKEGLKKINMTVIRKKDFNDVTNTYNYEQVDIKIVLK